MLAVGMQLFGHKKWAGDQGDTVVKTEYVSETTKLHIESQ